ncbi:MAG: TSCPD domain-containing protein, partial [Gammaproteobacteria bacterium]|nr:TSCPD domain-containing protein [Gammaproteobacteria bacterium]
DNGNQGLGDEGIPLRLAAPADAQPSIRKLEEIRATFQATSCPAAREAIQQALKETSEEILKDWREPESDF